VFVSDIQCQKEGEKSLFILFYILMIDAYSLLAVKQDDFSDVPLPEPLSADQVAEESK
jgi:hypothetical protein